MLGIHIVELYLAEVPIAVVYYALENTIRRMEREAELLYAAKPLLLLKERQKAKVKHLLPFGFIQRMKKVIINVVSLKMLKLGIEYLFRMIKAFYRPYGQLGCNVKTVAVKLGKYLTNERFAFAAVIRPGSVKIIHALLICPKQQLFRARFVYFARLVGGETHASVAEQRYGIARQFTIIHIVTASFVFLVLGGISLCNVFCLPLCPLCQGRVHWAAR